MVYNESSSANGLTVGGEARDPSGARNVCHLTGRSVVEAAPAVECALAVKAIDWNSIIKPMKAMALTSIEIAFKSLNEMKFFETRIQRQIRRSNSEIQNSIKSNDISFEKLIRSRNSIDWQNWENSMIPMIPMIPLIPVIQELGFSGPFFQLIHSD